MALTEPKREIIEFKTQETLQSIGQKLKFACAQWRAVAEEIDYGSGALSQFDEHCDIEVVISGKANFLSSQLFAVQVYVFDNGDERIIQLHALGHSGLAKAWYGKNGALKMSASLSKQVELKELLK